MAKKKNTVRSRAGRLGKGRGRNFEAQTAKWLKAWWGGEFRRTPMSGGWDITKIFDVMPMNEKAARFPCGVECKSNSSIDIENFFRFSRKASLIDDFWKQVTGNVKRYKKHTGKALVPMLLFTKPYYPVFIVIPFNLPLLPKLVMKIAGQRVFIYEQKALTETISRSHFSRLCRQKWFRKQKAR
jgi:hypothetical protein